MTAIAAESFAQPLDIQATAPLAPPLVRPPVPTEEALQAVAARREAHVPVTAYIAARAKDAKDSALDATAGAAALVDSPGVFEGIWAATTAVAAQTHNPYVAAGLMTVAGFATQIAGGYGIARLIARERAQRLMTGAHKLLGKLGVKGSVQTSLATDVGIALPLGAPVMVAAKQALDPSRTEGQNRRRTWQVAAVTSSIAAPANLAVAEGVMDVTLPKVLAAGAMLGGLALARSWAQRRTRKHLSELTTEHLSDPIVNAVRQSVGSEANYDLDEQQAMVLESDLVLAVLKAHGRTVSAAWIAPDHPAANLIRTREKQKFSDLNIPDLFRDYEDASTFLALVDTRRGLHNSRVVLGARVTGSPLREDQQPQPHDISRDGGSNMAMLRDMIKDGEITGEEIADYYAKRGLALDKCFSVETNFKIERAPKRWGAVHMVDLAYFALYKRAVRGSRKTDDVAIFAHINKASRNSLSRIGVDQEYVAGRSDLRTPAGEASKDRYDDTFKPVVLPNTGKTRRRFGRLLPLAPRQIFLTADGHTKQAV